jgi:hypothetical protein
MRDPIKNKGVRNTIKISILRLLRTIVRITNVVCGQVGHVGKWATLKTHQKLGNSHLNILTAT